MRSVVLFYVISQVGSVPDSDFQNSKPTRSGIQDMRHLIICSNRNGSSSVQARKVASRASRELSCGEHMPRMAQ